MASRADTGTTTVTTAGTRVRVNNIANKLNSIGFRAPIGNAGTIYYGLADVSATNGYPLYPGDESRTFNFGNGSMAFNEWWVDSATSGDKIVWEVIYEVGGGG